MIFWFFGYPGVGKDYVAEKFSHLFSVKHIDVDKFLTQEERSKLSNGTFTANDRLKKLKRVTEYLDNIKENIAVADSLPDKSSREFLRNRFKNRIIFIFITASQKVHEIRIKNRKDHFFTSEMLKDYIKKHWEVPDDFPHVVLENENLSEASLDAELLRIYNYPNLNK